MENLVRNDTKGRVETVQGDDASASGRADRRGCAADRVAAERERAPTSVDAEGFGESRPVASNATPAGRQQNRRVELVVSGESIGRTFLSTR